MSPRLRGTALLLVALGIALALPAAQPTTDRARAQAELRALNERITRVQRQVQQDTVEKNRLTRELRDSERAVAKVQGELNRLRAERADRAAARRKLEAERAEREAEQARTKAALEAQLRAAYLMGRSEPLKLLLNQRSPTEISRNLTYYGYLGRTRADQIAKIAEDVARIEQLAAQIQQEDDELAKLEAAQQKQLAELDSARKRRGQVLASLQKEANSRNAQLQRLRREAAEYERLIARLEQATKSLPYDPDAPFAQTRGRLHWPVAGKITVNYGATIPGLGKSTHIQIDTNAGADVTAVHEGRVIFADWISGRGQMVIIDHGKRGNSSYFTLYGHLGQMYVQQGDVVRGRQVIGTAGDTGGRANPGLYFELRHGSPVDPRPWFRSPAPPAR